MRRRIIIGFALVAALCASGFAQTAANSATKKNAKTQQQAPAQQQNNTVKTATPAAAAKAPSNAALDAVLTQLDRASENFHSCEADFVWEQYQKVVDEKDVQKGKVYFLHHDKDIHMAADIQEPEKKYLVFSEGKVRLYQPRIEQVTEYEVGKKKAEFESFLVLGFGGRGHDLPTAFNVSYQGTETLEGVKVVKLDLVPKSEKVHNMFDHITIWVDPTQDVSLKQQFFEPSGDYRTATYSNFKLKEKLNEEVFKLKTTSRTKVVKPQ